MVYTANILKVEDFARWKAEWDARAEMRKEAGQKKHEIFQDVDDPNTVVLLIEWESLDVPRKFAETDQFKEMLAHAGVTQIGMHYVEEVERGCS